MKKACSKYIIFVDHVSDYNRRDCYVPVEGRNILEAIKSFEKKFNVYNLEKTVYLYKMMERIPHERNMYRDVLINRGRGWNCETSPIETFVFDYQIKNIEKYEEE